MIDGKDHLLNSIAEFCPDRCAAGGGEPCDLVRIGSFTDKSGKVGDVSVLQCARCRHAISMPPIADVSFLYEGRESQDFQPDSVGLVRWIKDVAFRRQARILIRQIGFSPRTLLDFGCGSGQFTRLLGDSLSPDRVTGSDFFDAPPGNLQGRSYIPAASLPAAAGTFDVVTAMHVLEHDDDAVALLARISGMAVPGGHVVIEVPNVECVWARVFGRHWDAWYLPFHRTHFSEVSARRLLQLGGLEVLSVHGATVPTMGRTFANIFGGNNSLFWLLLGIALHPVQYLGEKITGRPSAIRLIARKR